MRSAILALLFCGGDGLISPTPNRKRLRSFATMEPPNVRFGEDNEPPRGREYKSLRIGVPAEDAAENRVAPTPSHFA